jgi:hypothetical protein
VTVVPSLRLRDQPHPLASVLEAVHSLAGWVQEVLSAPPCPPPTSLLSERPAVLGRNVAAPRAYRCPRGTVTGSRILLLDDLYTTGAHLHSASAALDEAGARSVDLLVLGRFARPEHPATRHLLEWSRGAGNPWEVGQCVRCAREGSA